LSKEPSDLAIVAPCAADRRSATFYRLERDPTQTVNDAPIVPINMLTRLEGSGIEIVRISTRSIALELWVPQGNNPPSIKTA
jgi:hypothetical protein